MSYFTSTNFNIFKNMKLRKPQRWAYLEIFNHFASGSKEQAITIIPTGVGKTTIMAMAPFGVSEGKVLIIAPLKIISNGIIEAISPSSSTNVYRDFDIVPNAYKLPDVYQYISGVSRKNQRKMLDDADIVVLNAQKLQKRFRSSLLNFLPPDYFDMIIIDESHHAEAATWQSALAHFVDAKVLKVTATNFRTDEQKITGKVIYKYSLAQAMASDYVKVLVASDYKPDELKLTVPDYPNQTFTPDQIYAMGIKDEDYVNRSVAYSYDCNKSTVLESIKQLRKIKEFSDVPHKIIAIACSIKHANDILELYVAEGMRAAVIHNEISEPKRDKILNDLNNHRLDVIINVAMLGEGFDHRYLTIGAIFRPFKSMLPYAQFVGRLLRRIPDSEAKNASDNIAIVVSHYHLGLEELWQQYRVVAHEAELIKGIKEVSPDPDGDPDDLDDEIEPRVIDIGTARESEGGSSIERSFLDNQLLLDRQAEDRAREEKINTLAELLGKSIQEAEAIYRKETGVNKARRLDEVYKEGRSYIDDQIKTIHVPALLEKHNFKMLECDLADMQLFKFYPNLRELKRNDVMIIIYINIALNKSLGKEKRNEWDLEDFERAKTHLERIIDSVDDAMRRHALRKNKFLDPIQ